MFQLKNMRIGMRVIAILLTLSPFHFFTFSYAQDTYNQIDEYGNVSQRTDNFNKHNNDTTRNQEIPKGFYTWTVDRLFGDITPAEPDTVPHLFMNTTFNNGMYGEYNHTGSNYTPRLSRIFINRPDADYFTFTQPYGFMEKQPDEILFMNTLSPYTTIQYDNCGDKTSGEDHIDAKFAVNVNKRLNFGFDLEYAYSRGYFQNQNQSHFNTTLFSSYTGDKYSLHAIFKTSHQKVEENGGITDDNYIVHPESQAQSYSENEIPTVLSDTWNRNDHQHLFLTHRYNVGFYRKVKMTDEEIKARQFAEASKKDKERREALEKGGEAPDMRQEPEKRPSGRPDNARIVGAEPKAMLDSLAALTVDTTRIKIEDQATLDSLMRAQAIQDSIDATMKDEFVPVTSFIHTVEWNNYDHIYQSYVTPTGYYKDTYYQQGLKYGNDSIYDQTKHMQIKNTFAIGLLEGFNKYMKAGLKVFLSSDYCTYTLPDTLGNNVVYEEKIKEHDFSVGARISKTQGRTLHFNAGLETYFAGENAGQLFIDFDTDLNFSLFGDTVQLAASAYFHRFAPALFQSNYHSKHLWWDIDDLKMETRTHFEGNFSYQKTDTHLRLAVDQIQNHGYYAMSYDATTTGRTNMTAGFYQHGSNISVLTAQLHQNIRLGPLNWENVVTYQNSSNQDVLPLPQLNIFSNLYLKFKIAKVLGVEIGADAIWFSKYYAPDYCPALSQFAVQKNANSRVELGGYPFIDVYANMVLKKVRFFVMMSHVNSESGNRMQFLAPHYPVNNSVIHFGVSWVFYN